MYLKFFKRALDFISSLILIALLSPIILILTAILFLLNKGQPFFLQDRPGKDERIFKIMKFKTMNDKKDENGKLLPFQERITPLGTFLRKYSLDELPQLFNVLSGDMSLIGPRPLLVKYIGLYNDHQKRRHEVKPGITGWAQVNGRNAITWDEKFNFDIWYVDRLSFEIDIKILVLTIKKVIKKEDVNSNENLNMPEFKGRRQL